MGASRPMLDRFDAIMREHQHEVAKSGDGVHAKVVCSYDVTALRGLKLNVARTPPSAIEAECLTSCQKSKLNHPNPMSWVDNVFRF